MNFKPLSGKIEPENLFLVTDETEYNYRYLLRFSTQFLDVLHKNGYTQSGPIGIHAESSDKLIFIIASCWLNNIPLVSFDPQLPDHKVQHYREKIHPEIVITDKDLLPKHANAISLKDFQLRPHSREPETAALSSTHLLSSQEDIFGYFFTSGTSGTPKIAPLKRRQMISAATSSANNLHPQPNESWLLCLPLYHIGGISVILRSLLYGSSIYRMYPFKVSQMAKLLSGNKQIVAVSLVPTMLKRLLDRSDFSTHRQLKGILLGGGPIAPQLLKEAVNRSIPVTPSYGMTETCAQIAANPVFEKLENNSEWQSSGKVFEPNKIEIRDDNNRIVNAATSGTIWLKGPQVFEGYHHVNKENAFDENGWFNTGDYGRLDEKRNLYIETRRTDLIITGGENLSPIEIETALKGIDGIKEAAVFGVPDEEWGQKVVAAVVLKSKEKPSSQTIQTALKKSLEAFKIPKEIIIVKSLPKTDTGKIKRATLQNLHQSK